MPIGSKSVRGLIGQLRIERDRGRMRAHVAGDRACSRRARALRAGRGGGAAGADDVLDHELLAERARHVLGDDARDDVGRPAGRERHDQGDGRVG